MSSELRLKKLRGSGGFIMATVNDDQQRKGNLGGPDLFLAPVGRLDSEKISKYYCNTCEKEYEGSPKIEYENPNEIVAENLVLLEKGQYMCTTCGSILAEYRNFSKPDEAASVGAAIPVTNTNVAAPPAQSVQLQEQPKTSTSVKTFSSITGLAVYDTEARKVGVVKEMGIQPDQSNIVLVVTKNDGNDITVKWDDIQKIGEIVLLKSLLAENNLKCTKCNYTNSQGSKFCESCGNKLK
ncbi:zinc-ribbon domain-containing protein [Candidatus Nitrosotalea okcheonensis]|nr:PRC-barrel domain-containing protein [Candidatus Nitrosotalea okcheonensis]